MDEAADSLLQQLERLRRERELYAQLLSLGRETEKEPFIESALAIVIEATGAKQAYLQLEDDGVDAPSSWYIASGFTHQEVGDLRSQISTGIVAAATTTGRTVETASALEDPRFLGRASVKAGRIEAVLCVPIGDPPAHGFLYLQGRREPGSFAERDRELAELLATHLEPLADALLARQRSTIGAADPTEPFRAGLEAGRVVGRSRGLATLLKQIRLVAPLDVTVLLTGPSGTGKSLMARVIHDSGPRARGPFVEVNCAAIPDPLVESELFGHERGAFTGAIAARPGRFELAQNGTLFLDEVGALSPNAQSKLLRVLQQGEFDRVGGARTLKTNARVIAATNEDLEAALEQGRFREDLFYRLHVLPVRLPPLSERRDDLPILARAFVAAACERHGFPLMTLSRAGERAVLAAQWPGNIRQLENVVEAAVIRATGDGRAQVEREHLFPASEGSEVAEPGSFHEATRQFQVELLERALADNKWNVSATARQLKLTRAHVYNLMRSFGIGRDI